MSVSGLNCDYVKCGLMPYSVVHDMMINAITIAAFNSEK